MTLTVPNTRVRTIGHWADGKNFAGWPCDEEAERLRQAFLDATDAERPAALERRWKPADEFVIEWRALTVTLLDELADQVIELLEEHR